MKLEKILGNELSPWMTGGGLEGDIVLSSRIRLARNLDKIPFPNRADNNQLSEVLSCARGAVENLNNGSFQYYFEELDNLQALDRYLLVEKHIVSPMHVQTPQGRGLIIRSDGSVSIMVNEEDHLRIQALTRGLDLEGALELANYTDDRLEESQSFAFEESLGYLTACPTNLGTGLRASVMLHLPALVYTKQLNRLIMAATQLGLAVRGLYGEGSESTGNIFQISNQLTLGYNEQEIVENLNSMVLQVVEQERAAREFLIKGSKEVVEDTVWRAYGMLRYARSISAQEALATLSQVRLGIDVGMIKEIPAEVFNELIVLTRPSYIRKFYGVSDMEPAARDRMRATVIRNKLQGGTE